MKDKTTQKLDCPHCEEYRKFGNFCGRCGKQLREVPLSAAEMDKLKRVYDSESK